MTIAGTLSSALSGLTAASKAAELVSSNIANATTPGYGRRTLQVTARSAGSSGQGVLIVGTNRAADVPLLNDRRLAQSDQGNADTRAAFYRRLETLMGTPDQATSLNGRVAALTSALTTAVSHPESEPGLSSVVSAARSLVTSIAATSKDIQAARKEADHEISAQVSQLNDSLKKAYKLNLQIFKTAGTGQDTSALQDQRQQVVDQIAQIVPLREVRQKDGSVSLYTTGGAVLLDSKPAVFGFAATSVIVPAMTQQAGGLSGLTLNGRSIVTSGDSSVILGGSLAANFAVRDDIAVTAQSQVDAVARDLVERFQDGAVDSTRAPGDPGLFTDSGNAFNPLNEVGLAQRLKLNATVDPAQGGALWHLRDGLGAVSPGPAGNTALLTRLSVALTADREPASGGFMSGQRSFSALASDLLSSTSTAKLSALGESTYASARLDAFTAMEAQGGVDSDQEMQSLLQIEQSFAANAKVIKTVDAMMQSVLSI